MNNLCTPLAIFEGSSRRYSILALSICWALLSKTALAGSATWDLNPTSGDWNTASNWTPETVPDQSTDVATFSVSNVTTVSMSSYTFLGGLVFTPGASAFTIVAHGALQGAGVSNNSGITQNVDSSANLAFTGEATAGDGVIYTNSGEMPPLGFGTLFEDTSTAGTATFINKGDSSALEAAYMEFSFNSSADRATIINETGLTVGAITRFTGSATAANSTITTYEGASLSFEVSALAGTATLIADGGTIDFGGRANGELARVELNHAGILDISAHGNTSTMTIGSLEGDSTGIVLLGNQQLTIGGNGRNTVFGGLISQAGSLVKTGSEALTLTHANSYLGGTTVFGGTLVAQARAGSATGVGPLNIAAGTLSGKGIIGGAVTIGTGAGAGAFFAPGVKGPDTLSSSKALTFRADGRYKCDLSLGKRKADQVGANGVTIEGGAQFLLQPKGFQTLAVGTVFTVLNNTAATPITGTFVNLADGAIINATAGNRLQASYSGGDGNDLTLTVVP